MSHSRRSSLQKNFINKFIENGPESDSSFLIERKNYFPHSHIPINKASNILLFLLQILLISLPINFLNHAVEMNSLMPYFSGCFIFGPKDESQFTFR